MILQLVILFVLIYLYKYKYINENILVSTIFIYLCLVIHYKQNEPFYFGFVNEPPENKPSDQSTIFNFQYNYAGIALKHPLKIQNGQLLNTFKMVLVAGSITAFMFGGLYFAFSKKKK